MRTWLHRVARDSEMCIGRRNILEGAKKSRPRATVQTCEKYVQRRRRRYVGILIFLGGEKGPSVIPLTNGCLLRDAP